MLIRHGSMSSYSVKVIPVVLQACFQWGDKQTTPHVDRRHNSQAVRGILCNHATPSLVLCKDDDKVAIYPGEVFEEMSWLISCCADGGLRELALFAGAGGGILADLLLRHQPVCAVEIDEYCQQVLSARQTDGTFHGFPSLQMSQNLMDDHGAEIVDLSCWRVSSTRTLRQGKGRV